jgi:hypothetical protein
MSMCPNVMVPIQIDLAIGKGGTFGEIGQPSSLRLPATTTVCATLDSGVCTQRQRGRVRKFGPQA